MPAPTTRQAAIDVLMAIAASWAENAEEGLTRRLEASDSDEDCAEVAAGDEFDLDTAKNCRDVWAAIDLLNAETK